VQISSQDMILSCIQLHGTGGRGYGKRLCKETRHQANAVGVTIPRRPSLAMEQREITSPTLGPYSRLVHLEAACGGD
jgi:hypothetical protein